MKKDNFINVSAEIQSSDRIFLKVNWFVQIVMMKVF